MAKLGKLLTPGFHHGIWYELTPKRQGSLEREIYERSGEYNEYLSLIISTWQGMSRAMSNGLQTDRDYHGYVPSHYSASPMGSEIPLPFAATKLFGEISQGNSWLQVMPKLYVEREEEDYRWIQGDDTARLAFFLSAGIGEPLDYMDKGGFVVQRQLIITSYDSPIIPVATIGIKTNLVGPTIPLLDTLGRENRKLIDVLGGNNLQSLLNSSNTFLLKENLPELYY